jgi:hypothetical protein
MNTCILCLGEELADIVPKADVGGRTGARGLTDGGLIHLQHTLNPLPSVKSLAAVVVVISNTARFPATGELDLPSRLLSHTDV